MSFLVTDRLSTGDNIVQVEVEGDTGRLTYRVKVVGIASGYVDFAPHTNSSAYTGVVSEINDQINTIRSAVQQTPPGMPSSAISAVAFPTPLRDGFTQDLDESTEVDDDDWDKIMERSFEFEDAVIKVPVLEGSSWGPENVGLLPLHFIVQEQDFLDTDTFDMAIRIPADAYIETVDISQFPCDELYPTLDSTLDRLTNEVTTVRDRVDNDLSTVSDAESTLTSEGGDSLGGLTMRDVQSLGASTLTNIKTRVEGTDPKQSQISSLEGTASSARDSVNSMGVPRCKDRFGSRVDSVERILTTVSRRSDELKNKRSTILSLLSDISAISCASEHGEIEYEVTLLEREVGARGEERTMSFPPSTEKVQELLGDVSDVEGMVESGVDPGSPCYDEYTGRLENVKSLIQRLPEDSTDCGDVARSIRNSVAQFASAASTYVNTDIRMRKRETKEKLVDEGEGVMNTVETKVDEENPCRSELLSRVRSNLSDVKSAGTRPESAIPCEEKHPDVVREVDSFRDEALSIRPPVEPEDIESVTDSGQQVISMIESEVPSDDPCRSELVSRVRGLTSRVEKLTSRVRIQAADGESPQQRREKLINDLLGALDKLESTKEDTLQQST